MSELLRGQKQAPRPAGNGDSRAREDSAGDGMTVIGRCPRCKDAREPINRVGAFSQCPACMTVHRPEHRLVTVEQLRGAVSPEITDAELDAAWAAWMEHWVTEDGRTAMRSALVAFLSTRGGQ
jgi:hypothetical protein